MTRATLLTAPYRTADGRWMASANVEMRSTAPGGVRWEVANIHYSRQPIDNQGDTITVKRVGNEWRAG